MQAEASLRGNRLGSFRGSLAAAAEANPNRNLAKQTARKSMRMMNPTKFNPGSTLANKPMSMGAPTKFNPGSTLANKPMSMGAIGAMKMNNHMKKKMNSMKAF